MIRALYSLLMWLARPWLRRKLARRAMAEPRYGHAVQERFGRYRHAAAHSGPLIWVHAVSLGEARAAAILLVALRQQLPALRLLLTHGTATGWDEGGKLLQPGDLQTWLPWDTPGAVARFLAHFQPQLGVLMETEIWPNLVAGCAQAGVPLVLANARLSEKSLREARRLMWLARPAYTGLAAVWAQTEADAQRLCALGAPVQGVLGNRKFDATPDAGRLAMAHRWRAARGVVHGSPPGTTEPSRPVLMLASSRESEEQMLLDVLKQNRLPVPMDVRHTAIKKEANTLPNDVQDDGEEGVQGEVQWLIVPRHPQRFDAVAALCESAGFAVSRRSQWADGPPPSHSATLWLGDTLGDMALYYGLADAALLGGSFAPLGGQNLIEAAACDCPVVMGPHTFNFADAADLSLAAGAALRVADMPQGVAQALLLVLDGPRRAAMQAAGRAFVGQHRGAAQRTALAVANCLAPATR